VSRPTSLSTVTALVTIPFVKKPAIAKRELARWHWKIIWILFGVISIFLIAKLTIHQTKSIIYVMSLDIIKETTTITAEFNSVKVY